MLLFKMLLAFCLGFWGESPRLQRLSQALGKVGEKVLSRSGRQKRRNRGALSGAVRDLCSPMMLLSFVLMFVFFLYSTAFEPKQLHWFVLRSACVAFVLFYALRLFPVDRMIGVLERKSPYLADVLKNSQQELKKAQKGSSRS